jgi:hypothetical protein
MSRILVALVLLLLLPAASLAQQWKRYLYNTVFPSVPSTWMESQTANPDLLLNGDIYFTKFESHPVIVGGGAPEVVYHDGTFYLYCWWPGPDTKAFQIHYMLYCCSYNNRDYPSHVGRGGHLVPNG